MTNTLAPDTLLSLSGFAAAWFTTVAATWSALMFVEKESKEQLADYLPTVQAWLQGSKSLAKAVVWAAVLRNSFEGFYGPRHFSLKCVTRSFLSSMLFFCVVLLIWAAVRPSEAIALNPFQFAVAVVFAIPANFLPDFLSIGVSRYVLRLFEEHEGIARRGSLVLANLFAACLLGASPYLLFMSLMGYDFGSALDAIRYDVLPLTAAHEGQFPIGVFFYTTLFTFTWTCLFALSVALLHLGAGIDVLQPRLAKVFVKSPMSAVKIIAVALVCFGYITFGIGLVLH